MSCRLLEPPLWDEGMQQLSISDPCMASLHTLTAKAEALQFQPVLGPHLQFRVGSVETLWLLSPAALT